MWRIVLMMKKAQLKMIENVLVLMFFFILLVMGVVFYSWFHSHSVEKTQTHFTELELVELAKKVPLLPELQCPEGIKTSNCLDILKVRAFANMTLYTENQIYYFPYLGAANLTVRQIYPESESITFYTVTQNRTSRRMIEVPISLYNPHTKMKAFGLLELVMYE